MKHVITSICIVGWLALAAPAIAAEEADEQSKDAAHPISAQVIVQPDGLRSLVHETIINAPRDRVWEAFSTVEGWKSWGVKFAAMDVRTAGSIESGYLENVEQGDPRNIVHRILAIVPGELLVTRIEKAPEGGPVDAEKLGQLWAVYELERVSEDSTLLRISGHGYGTDPEFDRMLSFFKQGNAASIEMMRAAITETDK